MEFYEIEKTAKEVPGEYILHTPSEAIVIVVTFSRDDNKIKAMKTGRLFEDAIENFKKIKLSTQEKRERRVRRCGGCKKKT